MTDQTFEISTKTLAQLVKPVVPLVNRDEFTPIIRSVQLRSSGKYLTATATDRFRAGIARAELETAPPAGLNIVIGLDELRALLTIFKSTARMEQTVTITVVENAIKVEQALGFGFIDASMKFPLVQGDYPKVDILFGREYLKEPVSVVGVNATHLADFRHAVHDGSPLIVRSAKEGSPLIVTVGDHFIGAIMPVRGEGVADEVLDSWAETLTAKPADPAKKARAKAAA